MSFNNRSLIITILALILLGCEKDEPEGLIKDGINDLNFTCNDSTSSYFFRGSFNNDSICLYDGNNDCHFLFGQAVGVVTYKPYFTFEDLYGASSKTWVAMGIIESVMNPQGGKMWNDEYFIRTEPISFGASQDSMVLTFLTLGVHDLRAKVDDDSISTKGFEVYIHKDYYNSNHEPDHTTIRLSSAQGIQPDGYFEITKIKLEEFGNHIEGYIQMKFKCKMYLDLAGKLTGDFVGDFEGEASIPISYDR
jgi:hypothetical protein